jgi:hypothetical protein
VDKRIGWEECDPESGVITQVLGRSYLDYAEARSHVGRVSSESKERFV